MTLTAHQKQVYDRIHKAHIGEIITLRGLAGTGKTYTATEIIKSFLDEKKKILVMTPTRTALGVVMDRLESVASQLTFSTLASKLTLNVDYVDIKGVKFDMTDQGVEKLKAFLEKLKVYDPNVIIKKEIMQRNGMTGELEMIDRYTVDDALLKDVLRKRFKDIDKYDLTVKTRFDPRPMQDVVPFIKEFDLVVTDEMPMVPEHQTALLEEAIEYVSASGEAKYAKFLFCGDAGQLKPVEGKMNHFMKDKPDNDKIFELTEVLRSTDEIAKVANMIRKGVKLQALATKYDNILHYKGELDGFASDYDAWLREADIVLTFTNANVNFLNRHIRRAKGFGKVGYVQTGETLLCTKNTQKNPKTGHVDFVNGSELHVDHVYTSDEMIALYHDTRLFRGLSENTSDPSLRSRLEELTAFLEAMMLSGIFVIAKMTNKSGKSHLGWIRRDLGYRNTYADRDIEDRLNEISQICQGNVPVVHATFGYARTVDKSQGSEWKNVLYITTSKEQYLDPAPNRPYTAFTRAKDSVRAVVVDDSEIRFAKLK